MRTTSKRSRRHRAESSPHLHPARPAKLNDRCSVLLIEDDDGHARLVQRALSNGHCRFEVDWVTSLADAVASLGSRTFDVLLCDLTLPDSRGVETVTTIRKMYPDLPVVILTSLASEQMTSTALEKGAQDYLLKDILATESCGAETVERAIRHAIYRQAVTAEVQRLYWQARHQQKALQDKNTRLAQLYKVAQTVVENVSHEFRTPLTVIKEYVALLREGAIGSVTKEQSHFLDVIGDRADDLNRLIDDMLDVSKLDAGLLTIRRSECEVSDIVRHVAQQLTRKAALKRVAFSIELEDHLPTVYCDADKASRTIINLVVNAIKFSGDSGLVRLTARFDQQDQEVVVEVVDNGPGIHEQDLQRLFRRFTQVNVNLADGTKGFGLGLSIAKEMVEMNLGRMLVTSKVGAGSCFSFTIPRADPVDNASRFLSRLASQHGSQEVLLCTIRADGSHPEKLSDIEPLLYYVLRTNDLIFRVHPDVWLALLVCDETGFDAFHKRLEKVIKQTNRNRLHSPLPLLSTDMIAAWNALRDREAILAEVKRCTRVREAMHSGTG